MILFMEAFLFLYAAQNQAPDRLPLPDLTLLSGLETDFFNRNGISICCSSLDMSSPST